MLLPSMMEKYIYMWYSVHVYSTLAVCSMHTSIFYVQHTLHKRQSAFPVHTNFEITSLSGRDIRLTLNRLCELSQLTCLSSLVG